MIQVIERAAEIMDVLRLNSEATLTQISVETRLKKSTLCTLLGSLCAVGYVRKTGEGVYALGEGLLALARPQLLRESLPPLAEDAALRLAKRTGEHAVVAGLRGAALHYVAGATIMGVMPAKAGVEAGESLYGPATGRCLLAWQSVDRQQQLIDALGLPGEVWREAATAETLAEELAQIRRQGYALRRRPELGSVALAAPVFATADQSQENAAVLAAIGVTLPVSRYAGENRQEILAAVQETAAWLGEALALRSAEATAAQT